MFGNLSFELAAATARAEQAEALVGDLMAKISKDTEGKAEEVGIRLVKGNQTEAPDQSANPPAPEVIPEAPLG